MCVCVCVCVCVCAYSTASNSVTAWNVACQAPLSDFPGKNIGVGCHSLLQGICPTQELNPHLLCLLHWQADFFTTVPSGKTLCSTYDLKRQAELSVPLPHGTQYRMAG